MSEIGDYPDLYALDANLSTLEMEASDAEYDAPGASTAGEHQTPGPHYSFHFHNINDAQDYFMSASTSLQKLSLQNDDWASIKSNLHVHAQGLYYALSHEPAGVGKHVPDEESEVYATTRQQAALNRIKKTIEKDPLAAEARCILTVAEVISVHENGVPNAMFSKQSSDRFGIEADLICSERMQRVTSSVRDNKHVALNVLLGQSVDSFARAPARFLEKKVDNLKVNTRKARHIKQGKDAKKEEEDSATMQPAPGISTQQSAAVYQNEEAEEEELAHSSSSEAAGESDGEFKP